MNTAFKTMSPMENDLVQKQLDRLTRRYKAVYNTIKTKGKCRNYATQINEQIQKIKNFKSDLLMNNAIKGTFKAKVVRFNTINDIEVLNVENLNTGEQIRFPWWCVNDFVNLPGEILDENQHPKIGSVLELYKKADGKIFPSNIYERKKRPFKANDDRQQVAAKMSRESLFDNAKPFVEYGLEELWEMFAKNCAHLSTDVVLQAINLKGSVSEKEQREQLLAILGIEETGLALQESENVEFKSSFIHGCKNEKQPSRVKQYQVIFKEIVAFANAHVDGVIYVGINNDGAITGIESELLNEVPFNTRADFEADFRNLMDRAINDFDFTRTIRIVWYKTKEDKVFCKLIIPMWQGNIVLLNGGELYVRNGAASRQLKNTDLINYIKKNAA